MITLILAYQKLFFFNPIFYLLELRVHELSRLTASLYHSYRFARSQSSIWFCETSNPSRSCATSNTICATSITNRSLNTKLALFSWTFWQVSSLMSCLVYPEWKAVVRIEVIWCWKMYLLSWSRSFFFPVSKSLTPFTLSKKRYQ